MKSIMDMPNLRHHKVSAEAIKANGGKPLLGEARYNVLAAATNDFPELIIAEDFMNGFLVGSSFNGNVRCQAAMQGTVF